MAATAAEANTVAQVVWEAVKVAALAALADRVERAAEWVVVASGAVAAAAAKKEKQKETEAALQD